MNIRINANNFEIRVDRRTELLGIIEIISNYKIKYPQLIQKLGNKNYIEDIEKKFNKYQEDNIIKLFNDIIDKNNFCYDAPVSLFLELNDDFTFEDLDDYPFKTRLRSDEKVKQFLLMLPEFAKKINFEKFYNDNICKYEKFIKNFETQLGDNKIIDYIMEYYNLPNKSNFIVNLIPFQTNGNYGTKSNNNVYANIGVAYNSTNEDDMYPTNTNFSNPIFLLHHEFSHSFINPLTEKYSNMISDDFFNKILLQMKQQSYSDKNTIISEHIIRALTLRYCFYINNDLNLYEKKILREENSGFIYIRKILESLVVYENNRNIYKNIEEFFPVILKSIMGNNN